MMKRSHFKENPYLWNKFPDGKLFFPNTRFLSVVCGIKDRMVQDFCHKLTNCHTVKVQDKENQPLNHTAFPGEEVLATETLEFWICAPGVHAGKITVIELGEKWVYQVLAMMDFNSIQKLISMLI